MDPTNPPPERTVITLADIKGFLEYMDANPYRGGDTRSFLVNLIEYLEKEAPKENIT